MLQLRIQIDQKIDRTPLGEVYCFQICCQPGPGCVDFAERRQLALERGLIAERVFFGVWLQKEIEGIDHGHFRDQVDVD